MTKLRMGSNTAEKEPQMVSDPKKQSSFGIFGWSNYSPRRSNLSRIVDVVSDVAKPDRLLDPCPDFIGLGNRSERFLFRSDLVYRDESIFGRLQWSGGSVLRVLASIRLPRLGRKESYESGC
jgi:hypothetical protein